MTSGWQITAAIALGASAVAFGAGWQIRSWKCESALLAQQEADQKAFNDQLAHQNEESAGYEQERTDGTERKDAATVQIHTIYKDRVISPDCALASRGLLQSRIDAENASLASQSGGAVPEDTASASASDQPGH